jgi:hypothetical protein
MSRHVTTNGKGVQSSTFYVQGGGVTAEGEGEFESEGD